MSTGSRRTSAPLPFSRCAATRSSGTAPREPRSAREVARSADIDIVGRNRAPHRRIEGPVTGSKDVKPWPKWARVLFWGGFACFLMFAFAETAAAAASGEFDWDSVRIALVVVAGPGLAVLFVSLVMRRRAESSMKHLDGQLAHLAQQVRQEQGIPADERPSRATDDSLRETVAATTAARTALWHGDPRELAALPQLHQVPAEWRPESPLARTMAQCTRTTGKITRQLRTLDRQKR